MNSGATRLPQWAQKRWSHFLKEKNDYLYLSAPETARRSYRLAELPSELWNCTHLQRLFLSDNRLNSIPPEIGKLTNLRVLNLRGNNLSSLPESLSRLEHLEELYLSRNQFSALPLWLINFKHLRILDADQNPLTDPPLQIAGIGLDAIRSYFLQQREQGTVKVFEAKLLIVGEPGAGKTTLARRITKPNSPMPAVNETTRGITISKWSFIRSVDEPFKVNIWDFGGQEIYHQTHQFFLTKNSLYALVVDTRKEDTDFYHWLNTARLLGGDSPIIVISNEMEGRRRDIPEADLRAEFPQFKELIRADFARHQGEDAIREAIKYHITRLPHIGTRLPRTWVAVRQALEADVRNYISLAEYFKLCSQHGFTTKSNALLLSQYLHNLGVILHYQNDSLLSDSIILKPEWATSAVYKVLDNAEVIEQRGHFNRGSVEDIWGDDTYTEKHDQLLRLMLNFRLCYEIPGQRDHFIAPRLLSDNPPSYTWDDQENAQQRYVYNFMPKGILTQFIVAMHRLIENQTLVWKSGVVLEKDGARAEIIERHAQREIRVRVSGVMRRELLAIVANELDDIHAGFQERLKYDVLIPCVCEQCRRSSEPYFFLYSNLKRRIQNQRPTIECENSYRDVPIQHLLSGTPLDDVDEQKLRDLLMRYTVSELNVLCFDLSARLRDHGFDPIDLEDIGDPGEPKEAIVVDLILYSRRRGYLPTLLRVASERRSI